MENTLTISEIKRGGMTVISERLKRGPAHIMKRNKQAAVVLSQAHYQSLIEQGRAPAVGLTAIQWLLAQTPAGRRSKASIDADLQHSRDW